MVNPRYTLLSNTEFKVGDIINTRYNKITHDFMPAKIVSIKNDYIRIVWYAENYSPESLYGYSKLGILPKKDGAMFLMSAKAKFIIIKQ